MQRILVIEDDPNLGPLIVALLEREPFEVLLATDGRTGLQLAQQHLPNLILCDLMLPILDGYAVLTALRQQPVSATIPFIFLTAQDSRVALRQGMRLGADDYLTKPFEIEELLDVIAIRLAKQAASQKFYASPLPGYTAEQLALTADLEGAIARSELTLHYQPQVELQTQALIGAEALLRWQHPQHGAIAPATFIPLAEQSGLIVPIGEWVLRTACQQVKNWERMALGPLRMAVNLSARQFSQATLEQTVTQVLTETALEAQWLELELTESMLVQDVDAASAMLTALRATGIRIAIDDFGTGYSSLSYLQRFPLDTLKIDRSFVHQATTNPKTAAIAITVIQMAHQLELQVVAEGVETLAELTFLQEHACDVAQGYWFSRPVPATAFAHLLSEAHTRG
jgi:EAL domain-containing protein (putative c-di-GMP-specific phosphodiesterase class I)/ActR/RegA family two-component response regulator